VGHVATNGTVTSQMQSLVGMGVSPLRRAGLLRFASSRCQRPQRLAPDGLPSLTQHGQAGGAGRDDHSGPFPCPGTAGLVSFPLRVNETRLAN
jgi:hypothetical protein